jgi:hypothetical protein
MFFWNYIDGIFLIIFMSFQENTRRTQEMLQYFWYIYIYPLQILSIALLIEKNIKISFCGLFDL